MFLLSKNIWNQKCKCWRSSNTNICFRIIFCQITTCLEPLYLSQTDTQENFSTPEVLIWKSNRNWIQSYIRGLFLNLEYSSYEARFWEALYHEEISSHFVLPFLNGRSNLGRNCGCFYTFAITCCPNQAKTWQGLGRTLRVVTKKYNFMTIHNVLCFTFFAKRNQISRFDPICDQRIFRNQRVDLLCYQTAEL